jgi:hypothetical protein
MQYKTFQLLNFKWQMKTEFDQIFQKLQKLQKL